MGSKSRDRENLLCSSCPCGGSKKKLTHGVNDSCHCLSLVEISYQNKRLAKLLTNRKEVLRTYGPDNGKRILLRLDQIAAAAHLFELSQLPQTRVHQLKADRDEQISIDVKHPCRLIAVPGNQLVPRKPDGGLDWSRIDQLTILEITDTH